MNGWKEDINILRDKLPKYHKNLFFKRAESYFIQDINRLLASAKELNSYEIRIEIAKIVASIGDAHTYINLPIELLCPLEFYWFTDGIYIINTADEYTELLYSRVTHINSLEISEVITSLKSIISYENEALLQALLPKYLPAIELLFDLYIVDNVDYLDINCELITGTNKNFNVNSCRLKEANHRLSSFAFFDKSTLPLYRRHTENFYWYEYLEERKAIYFKYNACRDMENIDVGSFCKELLHEIEVKQPEKLIVDLRNNKGGNSTLLDDFIDAISKNLKLNKEGHLFVIVGIDTFSSALLNAYSFKEKTKATIIGEPTGGKPNCYGEVQRFQLKNSALVICYSTKYYKIIEDDEVMSLIPDIFCQVTINDYIKKVDPCLSEIFSL